ncbi:hypothetical protein ACQF36_12555 [Streptomyces sp. Marseille-Q5077]|uniref:hypothetical protein n=1 Tax=Streptomyces sp. Marseille-Q5077 TaxID=3418995 RepID=UPI003D0054FC
MRDLRERYGATSDGGGYNPHENGTVFYFGAPAEAKVEYRRVELYVPGDHRDLLTAHLDEHRARQPGRNALRLLTGAWTTQALSTFTHAPGTRRHGCRAEGRRVEELAREVGARPRNPATLLRYLTMLGAVTEGRDGFRLTELAHCCGPASRGRCGRWR